MRIAMLQGAKTMSELAQRLYGLKADDPRVAAAAKALENANPTLPKDLGAAPATTTVVAPPINGLTVAAGAASLTPHNAELLQIVGFMSAGVRQMMAVKAGAPPQDQGRAAVLERLAQARTALKIAPATVKPVSSADIKRDQKTLDDSIAAFLRSHGAT